MVQRLEGDQGEFLFPCWQQDEMDIENLSPHNTNSMWHCVLKDVAAAPYLH